MELGLGGSAISNFERPGSIGFDSNTLWFDFSGFGGGTLTPSGTNAAG
jgi:hypothetical protein